MTQRNVNKRMSKRLWIKGKGCEKMRENIKKLFSLFLCLAMAIGLLPMAALAEGTETDVRTITQ